MKKNFYDIYYLSECIALNLSNKYGKLMEDSYLNILKEVGEDPNRAGLKDTPKRAASAMRFLTQGYSMNIE